jgi:hypothetical protein
MRRTKAAKHVHATPTHHGQLGLYKRNRRRYLARLKNKIRKMNLKESAIAAVSLLLILTCCSVSIQSPRDQRITDFSNNPAFKNIVAWSGQCGLGQESHLINTDRSHRYTVTVMVHWTQSGKSGQQQKIYTSEAGGDQVIGCSQSGTIPNAYYTYGVVGEVLL